MLRKESQWPCSEEYSKRFTSAPTFFKTLSENVWIHFQIWDHYFDKENK